MLKLCKLFFGFSIMLCLSFFSVVYADEVPDEPETETIVMTVTEEGDDEATLESIDLQAPSAPGNLKTAFVGDSSIKIEWNPSIDNLGVAGYKIYKDYVEIGSTEVTNYVLYNIENDDGFNVTVRAVDYAGNISDSSNTLIIHHISGGTAGQTVSAPYGLLVAREWEDKLTLEWQTDNNGGNIVYEVYNGSDLLGTTAESYFVVRGLHTGMNYSFKVRAKTVDGYTSEFSTSLVYVYDGSYMPLPVEAPQNLKVVLSGWEDNVVTLQWENAAVNVKEYVVYDEDRIIGTTSAMSYTVRGLINEDTYQFSVRAKDYDDVLSDASNTVFLYHVIGEGAPTTNITAYAEATNENVTVSGMAIANNNVQLIIKNSENEVVKTFEKSCETDGTYIFEFNMKDSNTDGLYTAVISCEGTYKTASASFQLTKTKIENMHVNVLENSQISVTGSTTIKEKSISLNVIGQNGKPIFENPITTTTDANGDFSFVGIIIPDNTPGGIYTAYVSYNGVIKSETFNYFNEFGINNVSVEINQRNVKITGMVSSGAGKEVSILITDKNDRIVYVYQETSGVGGAFSFTCMMPNDAVSGEYILRIGATGIQKPISTSFVYSYEIAAGITIDGKTVIIQGNTPAGAGKEVSILITDKNDRIVYVYQETSGEGGAFSFTCVMPDDAVSGIYSVKIGGTEITTPASLNFEYGVETHEVKVAHIDATVTIQNYVPAMNFTVSSEEGRRLRLYAEDSNQNIYVNQDIGENDGERSFSCTLPSLMNSNVYTLEIRAYENMDEPEILLSATIDSGILTVRLNATATCNEGSKVIGTVASSILNETLTVSGNHTYEYTLPTLLCTGTFSVNADFYSRQTERAEVVADVAVNGSEISVNGMISTGIGKTLNINVCNPNDETVYTAQSISGTGGNFEFAFTLPDTAIEGEYTVSIYGDAVQTPRTIKFNYVSATLLTVSIDIEEPYVIVSGTTKAGSGKTVTLNVLKKGNEEAFYTGTSLTDENGDYTHSISLRSMNGEYTVAVDVTGLDKTMYKNFIYMSGASAGMTAPVIMPPRSEDVTDTSIYIRWNPVQGTDNEIQYNIIINGYNYVSGITDTEFKIENLKPQTKYTIKIMAIDSEESQFIVSESVTVFTKEPFDSYQYIDINCIQNNKYNVILQGRNISANLSGNNEREYEYILIYNPLIIRLDDIIGQTYEEEKTVGEYDNITVTDVQTGSITFTVSIPTETGKVWSGAMNMFKFTALQSGNAVIYLKNIN